MIGGTVALATTVFLVAQVPGHPESLTSLWQRAWQHYQRAQQWLRQGNWAGYGEEVKRLEAILRKLQEGTAR